ncbi:serine/threonine-protein phosphatase 6 catalytic subunit [Anaeramoeba flamelloides]|uniref:protein-serine/threonine phosphatase n=1 Tax=Anaeramoeba flamelloides TaxID=1746091 RepID=A0ABQ8Y2R8_9EUKA|nr:serine/threonine-protein phosphatase 6 catalytic subunit [Anaeramoeba flamelloides]
MTNYSQTFSHLVELKLIPPKTVIDISNKITELLIEENNLLFISGPVTVVGDIHGQFFDLLLLFKESGYDNFPDQTPPHKYIFLGDYVDRGNYSLEVILALFILKLLNHECRAITKVYGFYEECFNRYQDLSIWKVIMNVFDFFSIGAVVDQSLFCVHGGLSPHTFNFFEMKNIWRFQEIPSDGGLCDLLWSDPTDDIEQWTPSPRGTGWYFGEKVVDKFLKVNNMSLICRSHQLAPRGYYWWFEQDPLKPKKKKVCTIWSAPNYCYTSGNEASVLIFENKDVQKFILYGASPNDPNHEYFLSEKK